MVSRPREPLFERGRVTDWLFEHMKTELESFDILLGRGVAPVGGGWTEGAEPGQGTFANYGVLLTGPGQNSPNPDTVQSVESEDWRLIYQLRSAGGVYEQAEYNADKLRFVWDATPTTNIEPVPVELRPARQWRVSRFIIVRMGEVTRNDSVQPPFWEITDTVTVDCVQRKAAST